MKSFWLFFHSFCLVALSCLSSSSSFVICIFLPFLFLLLHLLLFLLFFLIVIISSSSLLSSSLPSFFSPSPSLPPLPFPHGSPLPPLFSWPPYFTIFSLPLTSSSSSYFPTNTLPVRAYKDKNCSKVAPRLDYV